MFALALAAALIVGGIDAGDLAARAERELARAGYGGEALSIVDNALRHGAPPPRDVPPLARELLARPLAAADAAAIWSRSVPAVVADLAGDPPPSPAAPFDRLLDDYIAELAEAQAELLRATGSAPFDDAKLIGQLREGQLSADALLQVSAAVDQQLLERANARFVAATMRFARAVRNAPDLPRKAVRFDSAIGPVSIGSPGNDRHGPDAALIIDPGGDDRYERAPATRGAISVIIDLGGNDVYSGSDIAVQGLSALVDMAGDDRYEMQGPGLGAAIAGAAILVDFAGDDTYRLPYFGQGAAAFGLAALVDRAGSDRYELEAWGQGFAETGGLGVLWDLAGDDRYTARGVRDEFDRGGGLSGAQGAAMGFRNMLPGGVAILRDDDGDDAYAAEMFAQGSGYYYGLGVLWDRGGSDRYDAIRYAQGNGVHQAVGVLRDESGDDRYTLSFGVGQGMGLDLAVGVLADDAGDDLYAAHVLAQGTGTANGIGVLYDGGGANFWRIAEGDRQWGHAEWARGLPTLGLLVHDAAGASFILGERYRSAPPPPRKAAEDEPKGECPKGVTVTPEEIAAVRRDYFDGLYALGSRLRCAVGEAPALWDALATEIERDPATPLAPWIALAWRAHPPPAPRGEEILRRLDAHPDCGVRALALAAAPRLEAARSALRSSCFGLQAAGVRVYRDLGEPVPADAPLPAFLR